MEKSLYKFPKIRGIIFDWGGVLGKFNRMIFCRKVSTFTPHSPETIHHLLFEENLEELCAYERGERSSKEFASRISELISASQELTFPLFQDTWMSICISDTPEMERILKKLLPHIRPPVVLSNTNEMHWQKISQFPLMRRYFPNPAYHVLSFRYGYKKPDPRIFQEAIQKTGIEASSIAMVDDLEENVWIFEEMFGGIGIQFNCELDPIETLEHRLNELKII